MYSIVIYISSLKLYLSSRKKIKKIKLLHFFLENTTTNNKSIIP